MVVPSVGLDVVMQSGIRLTVVAPVVIGSLACGAGSVGLTSLPLQL